MRTHFYTYEHNLKYLAMWNHRMIWLLTRIVSIISAFSYVHNVMCFRWYHALNPQRYSGVTKAKFRSQCGTAKFWFLERFTERTGRPRYTGLQLASGTVRPPHPENFDGTLSSGKLASTQHWPRIIARPGRGGTYVMELENIVANTVYLKAREGSYDLKQDTGPVGSLTTAIVVG